ncbi:hypothetical protein ACFCV3_27010 [Kribbella sp. NPDC056345]|uniref:hypothetical protein n=1 Tax=Kribbella sp. NPDC056345 TaxID=3345789 RepID=UPI0035D8D81C
MPDSPPHGWAFLVARGRQLGYQALLVPDFLAESNEYGVLDRAAGGESAVEITPVHGLAAGDVVLVYRSERLGDGDLGWLSGPVTDQFGRPLELLYGFVLAGGGVSEVDDADLATARAEVIATYRRFLAAESAFEREISKPFVLRSVPEPALSTAPAHIVDPGAGAREPVVAAASPSPIARRLLVVVAVIAIALSVAVWSLLLRGRGGPVTDVELVELESTTVDCSQPVTVQARITTDAAATVTYHWESKPAGDSRPATGDFASAGTQTVQTDFQPDAEAGEEFTFTQKLVVDEPNSVDDSREYKLTCR